MNKQFNITPMTDEYASQILTWKYPSPYDVYNITDEEDKVELLENNYFAVLQKDQLFGYICFGKSAQVPNDAWAYEDVLLTDIGLGMKPEYCGQKLGFDFVLAGLEYGIKYLDIKGYRLSVIESNIRAQNLYKKLGFSNTLKFEAKTASKKMFQVMTRDELFNYQTEKIAFEPLSMELLDSLHHYLSNEVVNKYIGWPLTKTMEESKVYLEELLKRHQSGKFKYVSVIDKKSKVHLGTGMLFGFDIEAKHVEVGYVIDQDQWGKGYGSDIVKLLKAYAFEHLKLNKMYARVVNINEASAKVLSKNGFELEATLKDYYKIDGQLRNCDYYSVYPIKD